MRDGTLSFIEKGRKKHTYKKGIEVRRGVHNKKPRPPTTDTKKYHRGTRLEKTLLSEIDINKKKGEKDKRDPDTRPDEGEKGRGLQKERVEAL